MFISIVLLFLFVTYTCAIFYNDPDANRTLIVLAAPSVWDDAYRLHFEQLIRFQIDFAKTIHDHDNVVIIADKHTMPFVDGRSHAIKDRLPVDAIIDANLYDMTLRDYAPFGIDQLIKFAYKSESMVSMAAQQIDQSMQRFIVDHKIDVDKREPEMMLNGAHVVDNGVNKAIVDHRVLVDNHGRLPDWAIMIKLFNAFKKVAIVNHPLNGTKLRLDDIVAFIDDQIVVIPAMGAEARAIFDAELYKKFRDDIMLIDLPSADGHGDLSQTPPVGNCGLYTALLATDRYLYVPVFGNDPANWQYGHSTMMDRMVLQLLEVNTRKTVVPVNMPRAICELGISLRALAWNVRGERAKRLVEVARWQARRRFVLARHR